MASCAPSKGFMTAKEASSYSKMNASVWQEICAIQQHVISASTSCGERSTCVNISGNTPFTFYPKVDSVTVVSPGTGYFETRASAVIERVQTEEIYLIDDLFLSTEMPNASFNVSVNTAGGVQALTVTSPGASYTTSDVVRISHPIGTGFSGQLTLSPSGEVTGVTIQTAGSNYTAIPVSVDIDSTSGEGAEFQVNRDSTGAITSVTVTDGGYGYSSDVTLDVISYGGVGAKLVANVSQNIYTVDAYKYYLAYTNASGDKMMRNHLSQVISYFTGLGYQIRLNTNPDVPGVLMWTVCWC